MTTFDRHAEREARYSDLDWAIFERILEEHVRLTPNKAKYLDIDIWLRRMSRHLLELGLDQTPPRRILDIGTGPGYFPYLCRRAGHNCVGLDRPGTKLYQRLCDWVGTTVVHHRICPMEPLPAFDRPFDLVTAIRAPFNYVPDEQRTFSLKEWEFFLTDLHDHVLRPGGRFFMKMIDQVRRVGPRHGTPALMRLFEARGAVFPRGTRVDFRPLTR